MSSVTPQASVYTSRDNEVDGCAGSAQAAGSGGLPRLARSATLLFKNEARRRAMNFVGLPEPLSHQVTATVTN